MLKFQAVAEKTAKSFRGLLFCRTLYRPISQWIIVLPCAIVQLSPYCKLNTKSLSYIDRHNRILFDGFYWLLIFIYSMLIT